MTCQLRWLDRVPPPMLGTWSSTRQHSLWSLFHTLRVVALWQKQAIHHHYQHHHLYKHLRMALKSKTSYRLNLSIIQPQTQTTIRPIFKPQFLLCYRSRTKMSPLSKVFASWCKKHADGDDDDNDFDYAPAACMEGNGDDDDGDYDVAPAASLEGDDDDDGSYDYAPAA
ncbi:hypothetical protein ES319_A05G021500v1 [Gossypium barbadense]|uniref:Uncharacterized protein n=2 Tax=Gossypium TaxID=3633 RepID=A0A5J5VHU4_GOSBA|nr:hypothetical protein ES319_A05G021500v1 [Gossypium barbadense]TYI24988.1 hypothetical protein ES332_A05G022200v1 [Gossypium tomentosum]